MSPWKLRSPLANEIQHFIHLRRLSDTDYQSQTQLLQYFDRFLFEQQITGPPLTREITDAYLQSLSHLAPRSRANRFCVVRLLCRYLARSHPSGYVPEPLRIISSQMAHPPYIYTPSEIQALMAAASKLPPAHSLRPLTYRTLLGLLHSTGIRIGEALALNRDNFQEAEQRLYIAQGKFRKARWVPLSPSTSQALHQYLHKRIKIKPSSPDSPFFLNQRSRPLTPCTINQTFHYLLRQCGISHSKLTGLRIHDLRHTFAVQRLLAWYRDGQDVNARLPSLATYMGHVDVHSTHVYLQATPDLMAQVDQRFYHHYLHRVKPQGGTP